ncbi:MAG TPA: hypothetical protein VGI73_10370 [Solirubrobacterales bacterium]
MNPSLRRLYAPQPVAVRLGPERKPLAVDGVAVETVREQWVVEDRWWDPEELRRAYYELALADGRVAVVYRSAVNGRWYRQRA